MQETTISTKQRIQWIDALRGFTMLLVVFQHIHSICLHTSTPISLFAITFRMPLFFFISGFIAYNISQITSFGQFKSLVAKKTRIQALPTIVFGLLFTFMGINSVPGDLRDWRKAHLGTPDNLDLVVDFFTSSWKHGYWFTWVLLGLFIIYFVVTYALHRLPRRWTHLTLIGLAVGLFIYSPINSWPCLSSTHTLVGFLSIKHIAHYLIFFVFGNIVACHRPKVLRWLNQQHLSALVILLFLGIYIALQFNHQLWLPKGPLCKWVVIIANFVQQCCGILTMVLLFSKNEQVFSQQTTVGRTLQFIGRRTLDIYLIHYFFLSNMGVLGTYLKSNILSTTLSATLLAAVVVMLSLAVSAILRLSPFLAHYLFGVKYKSTNQ